MNIERINLMLDSSKRQNINEAPTNFSVNLVNPLFVQTVRLKSCCIPLTYYNILEASMFYTIPQTTGPAESYSFIIPSGRYSISDLLASVNSYLASSASLTYGTVSLAYNYSSGVFTFTLVSGSGTAVNGGLTISPSNLTTIMGFTNLSGGFTIASTLPTQLISSDYLKLSLTYLDGNIVNISNSQTSSTFIIENNIDWKSDSFGTKLIIQNPVQDTGGKNNTYTHPIQLQTFKVTIRDRNDNIIDLNGVDWWAMVEVYSQRT